MNSIHPGPEISMRVSHGYWNRPFRNCPPCGDAAGWLNNDQESWLLVMDAIGHGPVAHHIARLTLDLFKSKLTHRSNSPESISDIIQYLHNSLLARDLDEQAALNLYRFDHCRSTLEMIAIGNFQASLITPQQTTRLTSQNGMIGGRLPKNLNVQKFSLKDNTILAVLSDGINTLSAWPALPKYVYGPFTSRSLKETAQLIVDGYHHDHDDASCALVRASSQEP